MYLSRWNVFERLISLLTLEEFDIAPSNFIHFHWSLTQTLKMIYMSYGLNVRTSGCSKEGSKMIKNLIVGAPPAKKTIAFNFIMFSSFDGASYDLCIFMHGCHGQTTQKLSIQVVNSKFSLKPNEAFTLLKIAPGK